MASSNQYTDPRDERSHQLNRRAFLGKAAIGVGAAALSGLLGMRFFSRDDKTGLITQHGGLKGVLDQLHHPAKARRVIYLFQSGGPSQLESFDYKPLLDKMRGQDLPESVRQGQRLTGMTNDQESFPLVGSSLFPFQQHGESGAHISSLFPYRQGGG